VGDDVRQDMMALQVWLCGCVAVFRFLKAKFLKFN
jgi:hypothetical protein